MLMKSNIWYDVMCIQMRTLYAATQLHAQSCSKFHLKLLEQNKPIQKIIYMQLSFIIIIAIKIIFIIIITIVSIIIVIQTLQLYGLCCQELYLHVDMLKVTIVAFIPVLN